MRHRKLIENELRKHNITLPTKKEENVTREPRPILQQQDITENSLLTQIKEYQTKQQKHNRNTHQLFAKKMETVLCVDTKLPNESKLRTHEIMQIKKVHKNKFEIVLNEKLIYYNAISIVDLANQIQVLQAVAHKLQKENYLTVNYFPTVTLLYTTRKMEYVDIPNNKITYSKSTDIMSALKVAKTYTDTLRLNQVKIELLKQGREDIVTQLRASKS